MANIVYEFRDRKIKEYLGDINFFLEQRNMENMREVEKKDAVKKEVQAAQPKLSYEDQKKQKSLQNRLSKVESQIKQLEEDIRKDDRELESNYDKHIENASFFTAYNRKKADLEKLMEDWENVQMELDNWQLTIDN
jgi:ATP-binding cassette subfamily F protein 3